MPEPDKQSRAAATAVTPSSFAAIDPVRLLRKYWILISITGVFSLFVGVAAYMVLIRTVPSFTGVVHFAVQAARTTDVGELSEVSISATSEELEIYQETERQIMVSSAILGKAMLEPVVRNSKTLSAFSRDGLIVEEQEALRYLSDITRSGNVTGTTLIRLSVKGRYSDEAADIANAIADTYLANNEQRAEGLINDRIKLLREQIETVRNLADLEKADMEALLAAEGLTDTDIFATPEYAAVVSLRPRLDEVRTSLESTRTTLSGYEDLQSEGDFSYPDSVISQASQSPLVFSLLQQIQAERARLVALRQTRGKNHREVIIAEDTINALEAEYETALESERAKVFRAEIDVLRQNAAQLQASEQELVTELERNSIRMSELRQVIAEYEQHDADRELHTEAANRLDDNVQKLELLRESGARVILQQRATPPDEVSFPQPIPVVVGTSILICGIVGGLILLREFTESRVRSPSDVMLIPKTRMLGYLPSIELDPTSPPRAETATADTPTGPTAEAVRSLRTLIMDAAEQRGHKTILLASGLPGSGTTTVVSNLGISFHKSNRKTLIIDANTRKPKLHNVFGTQDGLGLSDVLSGKATLQEVIQSTGLGPDVLTAGKDNIACIELFSTSAVADLLDEAKARYDFILIDAAPAAVGGDALALAAYADVSLVLARAYAEQRGLIARMRNQFVASPSEFFGVIVNGVRASAGGYFKRNYRIASQYNRAGGVLAQAPNPEPSQA